MQRQNVQLSSKEAVKVFVEIGSNRILGFAPEHSRPLFAGSIKYRETVLLHARDIEMWVARYRTQQELDAQQSTYRQIERESVFRKSLRSAIAERNQHVNPFNRALNDTLVKLMDRRYDQIMAAKANPVMSTLAEQSEMSQSRDNEILDMALASPQYKAPGDQRVSGGAVMNELEKTEYDKRHGQ